MTTEEMVEKFLCPGCVVGSDTKCGRYKAPDDYHGCLSHCLGTRIMPGIGLIALGMPKGFNRAWKFNEEGNKMLEAHHPVIQLYPAPEKPQTFDWLNVPVWALEHEGFLFVRCMRPRISVVFDMIVEGGKAAEICPQATNVTEKYESYD